MKISATLLVASFGILVTLFVISASKVLPNRISLEHLQVEGFLAVNGQFESAKLAKNESQFAQVIVRIKEIKAELNLFQEQTQQKISSLQPHNYLDQVSLEIELIAALKVDQASNWIAYEILAYQAGIAPLVYRQYAVELDAVIKSEELRLANLSILGKEAQKLVDEGLKQRGAARQQTNELIQHKLDQIITDAERINDKLAHQYEVEMLKFNLLSNQDLNLIQKFYVARVTSVLSYSVNYAKSLKEIIRELLQ